MDCRDIRPTLSAFHDNESSSAQQAAVEAHLQDCPACARLLAALKRLDANVEIPEPGPEYWDDFNRRVERRIEERSAVPGKAGPQRGRGWIRQQLRYLIPAAAAAALVVWIIRLNGMTPYSPVSPEPRHVEETSRPASDRPVAEPAAKAREPAGAPAAKSSPGPSRPGRAKTAREGKPVVGPASPEPYRASVEAPAAADGEKGFSPEPGTASKPSVRVPETESAAPGAVMQKSATRFRAMTDRAEETARPGAADALGDPSCDDARRLASEGRFRDAEISQRTCLARDASPRAQEGGLVFLAELLDRQARFSEADTVIDETRGRFPDSRVLDLYRRQRPQVQHGELPFPATQR